MAQSRYNPGISVETMENHKNIRTARVLARIDSHLQKQ
jgi:hypothetical protein